MVPDFQSIMLPLLRFIQDGRQYPLIEVIEGLTIHFNLSEEDLRAKVPSGQQPLFKNRVTWAISYLKNSGLIYYPQRGVYQITEAGKKILEDNLESINLGYLKKFEAFKKWQNTPSELNQNPSSNISPIETKTPDEIIGNTINSLNSKLAFELLEIVKGRTASDFETFVLELLNKMGYGGADDKSFQVVGKSGDNGIDGIIYEDQLGIDQVYVQAKKWTDNKVQSKDIRDFIGALSLKGTNKGVFITTSDFTDDARKTVQINPQNRIILINGQQLAEYAVKHNVGVYVKAEYQVKALNNDFFEEL